MELNDFTRKLNAVTDMFGGLHADDPDEERATLEKRFVVPPFSVLDARQGYWQERKRQWLALGIKGEEGRVAEEATAEFGNQRTGPNSPYRTNGYKNAGRCFGQDLVKGENPNFGTPMPKGLTYGEVPSYDGGNRNISGTSVFDPVLCEFVYKSFVPEQGKILDPFAGESTKGIVAGFLGYDYVGVELRQEQIDANSRQYCSIRDKVEKVVGSSFSSPSWLMGDSSKLIGILDDCRPFEEFDFIWTSPPYYDLEIYSESEKDGSAFETYEIFMKWYEDIFRQAVAKLKNNRFLAVKVGEIRDEKGFYRNFERDNIDVFERLGLHHYNRLVLVTAVGSLPVRIGKQFSSYRKVGNTHQMIYTFWKGDNPKLIPQELGYLSGYETVNAENS